MAAIALPVLSVVAVCYDFYLGYARGEFPAFADSPAFWLPAMALYLCAAAIWSSLHLLLVPRRFKSVEPYWRWPQVTLSRAWLVSVSMATVFLVALLGAHGSYWYASLGLLWLHYYLSIAATKPVPHET